MRYIIRKAMKTLWWNKRISVLMIIEITLGMSVFVYSANLYYSLSNEEAERKGQDRDLVLEISSDRDFVEEQPLTRADYEKLQELTGGRTFLYIALSQVFFEKEESCEFWLVLADYKQMGLDERYSYWGEALWEKMETDMNPVPELPAEKMSEELNNQNWKTEEEDITLKDCVIAPIKYMDQMQEEIYPGAVHAEWSSSELPDAEGSSEKIEKYLQTMHGNTFHYRIYSPETELRNHAQKVKISIGILNKAGMLSLLTFSFGMLAIFGLLFEHREEEFGIDLACGADYRQLLLEIFLEIMILNGAGTILGFFAGWALTYHTDLGIMIGAVKVQGDIRTYLSGCAVCTAITGVITVLVFGKLKNREIVRLLKRC